MDNSKPRQAAPKPDDTPLQTNIVTNIPIHMAGNQQPATANHQDDSKLMRDVGDQLAKEDKSKPKHHFFSKPKPDIQPKPVPAQHQPVLQQTAAPVGVQAPNTASKPVAKASAKPNSKVPFAVIVITLFVTGGLIFLAYSSLK